MKGNYRNDYMEGAWVGYDENGTLESWAGTFKNGVNIMME